jgi:flagellar hook-length control protein FliK
VSTLSFDPQSSQLSPSFAKEFIPVETLQAPDRSIPGFGEFLANANSAKDSEEPNQLANASWEQEEEAIDSDLEKYTQFLEKINQDDEEDVSNEELWEGEQLSLEAVDVWVDRFEGQKSEEEDLEEPEFISFDVKIMNDEPTEDETYQNTITQDIPKYDDDLGDFPYELISSMQPLEIGSDPEEWKSDLPFATELKCNDGMKNFNTRNETIKPKDEIKKEDVISNSIELVTVKQSKNSGIAFSSKLDIQDGGESNKSLSFELDKKAELNKIKIENNLERANLKEIKNENNKEFSGEGNHQGFESLKKGTEKSEPFAIKKENLSPNEIKKTFENLVQDAKILIFRNGSSHVDIQLTPDSYGKVRLTLDLQGSEMIGKITVEKKEALALLAGNIESLKEELRNQGFKVHDLDLEMGNFENNNREFSKNNSEESEWRKDFIMNVKKENYSIQKMKLDSQAKETSSENLSLVDIIV